MLRPEPPETLQAKRRLPLRERNRHEQLEGRTDRQTDTQNPLRTRPLPGRASGSGCAHRHTQACHAKDTHSLVTSLSPRLVQTLPSIPSKRLLAGVWGDGAGGAHSDLGVNHRMSNCFFGRGRQWVGAASVFGACVCLRAPPRPPLHSFPNPAISYPPSGPRQFPKSPGGREFISGGRM